jgi:hypothetical protein
MLMRAAILRSGLVLAVCLTFVLPAPGAVTDQKIKDAIRFGISFLNANVEGTQNEGQAALVGLALLEAGVDPADETIQKIAARVRATAVAQRQTYFLSLSIMFLDRMGQEVDDKLIQSMAVRLIAGQANNGGWAYYCPGPPSGEIQRLEGAVNEARLKGSKDKPKIKPSTSADDPAKSTKLDPDIEDMARDPKKFLDYSQFANPGDSVDNSNTQFAILGLWAARRHAVPVENALSLCERRFRMTQVDGGWFYAISDRRVTPSMTCAGLLGLAIGMGNKAERERRLKGRLKINPDGSVAAGAPKEPPPIADPLRNDVEVQRGYQYLVNAISGRTGPGPATGAIGGSVDDLRDNLYLMWSLERVCMTYGWAKIGNVDWHIWGADRLLSRLNPDGGWGGSPAAAARTSNVIDTSFAVMFLCRANLVRDLSSMFNRKLTGKTGSGDVKPSTVKEGSSNAKNTDPKNAGTSGELQSGEMAKALTLATGDKQAELIKEYTDKKGSVYTQALIDAIPNLGDEARKAAREALAQRMARMSADTLRQYLQHDNPEARRAAAYGAAMREEKEMIPDLIAAIGDPEDLVVRAARVALRSLSNNKEDFGPPPGANEGQKKEAMAAWTAWMKKQK